MLVVKPQQNDRDREWMCRHIGYGWHKLFKCSNVECYTWEPDTGSHPSYHFHFQYMHEDMNYYYIFEAESWYNTHCEQNVSIISKRHNVAGWLAVSMFTDRKFRFSNSKHRRKALIYLTADCQMKNGLDEWKSMLLQNNRH